jgi:hypothetical protein
MANVVFPNGIRVFTPNEKAPDFVKADLVINRNELQDWLKTQQESIKLSLKASKKGGLYLEVNTFVPKTNGATDDIPF